MRRLLVTVLLAATFGACAARVPESPAPARQAPSPIDFEEALAAGCYRCLEATLAQVGADTAQRFQLLLLLTLRAKELGLPFESWLDEAATTQPLGPEWQLYLDIARSVRVDPLSGDREVIMASTLQQRRQTTAVLEWRSALATGDASPLFRTYLDLTLACSLGEDARREAIAAADARFADVPLVEYRIGTCGSPMHLARLGARVSSFVDVELPLGRNALDSPQPDQEDALRRFAAAAAAFPESPLVRVSIGAVHQDREEWDAALDAYDATLAMVPTHRDALLGRAVALSNLSRHEEAIAAATRLLELGDWFIGGAYFWRAWNLYHLGRIDEARTDLDQARTRGAGAAVLALSGLVAWRQRQLSLAEAEFQEALRVDAGQCESAAFLGGVQTALRKWSEAASSFQHAQQCFGLTIALRRTFIEEIRQGPGSEAGKAGQIARHERAIAEAEMHRDDARQSEAAVRERLP